jgi:hypothetical protein
MYPHAATIRYIYVIEHGTIDTCILIQHLWYGLMKSDLGGTESHHECAPLNSTMNCDISIRLTTRVTYREVHFSTSQPDEALCFLLPPLLQPYVSRRRIHA